MRSFGIYIVFGAALLGFALFIFFYRGIARIIFTGFGSGSDRAEALLAENALLKEDIFRLESGSRPSAALPQEEIVRAGVYSRYPFFDKETLIIDFGSEAGATSGMPVIGGERFLLGEIISVSRNQSEVRTIFDPRWVGSVFIRLSSSPGVTARGVLKGGATPRVELISSEYPLLEGDVVVNASEKFPFAIPIGVLLKPKRGEGGFWEEAPVRPIVRIRDTYFVSVFRR